MVDKYAHEYEVLSNSALVGTVTNFSLDTIRAIVRDAELVFQSQPTVLDLEPNIFIVGDVHGQLHDILNYFRTLGSPMEYNYLFLGDIVDRGVQSVESLLLVLICKIRRPNNFFIIRGNHETLSCHASSETLSSECEDRFFEYGRDMINTFYSLFDSLPLAAVIGERVLCVHGCVASDFNLDELRKVQLPFKYNTPRIYDDELFHMVESLLWSDPLKHDANIEALNAEKKRLVSIDGRAFVTYDSERNTGELVLDDVIQHIMLKYDLQLIVRGHEYIDDGVTFNRSGSVCTIFGASNYAKGKATPSCVMYLDRNLTVQFYYYEPQQ